MIPEVFDPEFITPQGRRLYQSASRLLLLTHPLLDRDKILGRLQAFLNAQARKAARKLRLSAYPSPLLSVVIPCYNYGQYLPDALESVFNQTFQDWEAIVVDDGSTDPETVKLLSGLERNPRLYVHHQENQGLSTSRNHGIQLARGKYVCCLDADDTLEPTYFEKALSVLESRPETGFVYSWARMFSERGWSWQPGNFNFGALISRGEIYDNGLVKKSALELIDRLSLNFKDKIASLSQRQAGEFDARLNALWEQLKPEPAAPLVSVALPLFWRDAEIRPQLEGFLRQSGVEPEILLLAYGSPQENRQALEALGEAAREERVRVIYLENRGWKEAVKSAHQRAKSDLLYFPAPARVPESDELAYGLEVLQSFPRHPWVQKVFFGPDSVWQTEDFNLELGAFCNLAPAPAVFRKAAWEKVEGFKEAVFGYSDWEFWIALSEAGFKGRAIPEPLFNYRVHEKNMSAVALTRRAEVFKTMQKFHPRLYRQPGYRRRLAQARSPITLVENPFVNLEPSAPASGPTPPAKSGVTPGRILFALPWLTVGGVDKLIYQLIEGLSDEFEFYLLLHSREQLEWYEKFYRLTPRIYTLPGLLPPRYWGRFAADLIRRHRIDLAIPQSQYQCERIIPFCAREIPELKTAFILHSDHPGNWQMDFAARERERVNGYAAVSDRAEESLKALGINAEKIRRIYNGIDLEREFNPRLFPDKAALRRKWGLPEEGMVIAYTGRLSEEKRPLDLVEIARLLKDDPGCHFLAAGDGPFYGPMVEKIKAEKLENFRLPGFCREIPELLSACDLLLLTSDSEGLPYSVAEAAGMGLPCLATRVGAVGEVVEDGVNGFLFEVGAVNGFAEKIRRLRNDPGLYQKLQQNCREKAEKFSLSGCLAAYRQFFRELIRS